MQSTKITTLQKQNVNAQFLNSKDVEVPVDGVPTWSSSDESIVTVESAGDGHSAFVIAGSPGIATITVTADSKIGSDIFEISNQFQVEVVNDEAVKINFTFDDPVDK